MIQKLIRQRLRWRCVIVLTVPEKLLRRFPGAVQQLVDADTQASGQRHQQGHAGQAFPSLPFADRLVRDIQTLGQLTLSQLLLTAQTGDKLSDFLIADLIHHPSLLPSIVRKRAAKSIYRQ